MRNREYFFRKLQSIQTKLTVINNMVSTNSHPRDVKGELSNINDIVEDIATQLEREPLDGRELNNTSNLR
jgi:uncharacterized protein YfkK (UPF0435 family)